MVDSMTARTCGRVAEIMEQQSERSGAVIEIETKKDFCNFERRNKLYASSV